MEFVLNCVELSVLFFKYLFYVCVSVLFQPHVYNIIFIKHLFKKENVPVEF